MTKQVNGGTSTEKHVKAVSPLFKGTKNGKGKVSTNGRARRAEFIQRYGKVIASTWAGLTGKSKGPVGVQKKLPELNVWQIDYGLVKLGLKKTTCKALLQWIKDDEVLTKVTSKPVMKKAAHLANSIIAGMKAQEAVVQCQKKAEKGKPKSKALIAREKREAESVERFKASSLPSEVIVGSLR